MMTSVRSLAPIFWKTVSQIALLRLTPSLTHKHANKPKRPSLSSTRFEHSKPSFPNYGDDSAEPPGDLPRCAFAQSLRSTHRRRRLASSCSRFKKKKAKSSVPRLAGSGKAAEGAPTGCLRARGANSRVRAGRLGPASGYLGNAPASARQGRPGRPGPPQVSTEP